MLSLDSSVSTVTGLLAERSGNQGKRLFLLSETSGPFVGPTHPPVGIALCSQSKAVSPLSSFMVMNDRCHTYMTSGVPMEQQPLLFIPWKWHSWVEGYWRCNTVFWGSRRRCSRLVALTWGRLANTDWTTFIQSGSCAPELFAGN
jgi:hypothetical protein